MSQFESYRANLHILSPVHVGAGQELDPFSYVMKDKNLLLFDLLKWIELFPNKEELYKKMDSDDFIALRSYIAENFDDDSAVLDTIPIESPEVIENYRKAVFDKASQNQALINFMTRNEINRIPYIPGSSIKGAIRTAIANRFVKPVGITSKDFFKAKYDQKIFGSPTDDPMKNLKVADVSLDKFGSVIYEAREHSFKENLTPKGAYEAAVSLIQDQKQIVYPLHFSIKPFDLKGKTIDLKFVVEALYQFYLPKFKEEFSKFYSKANAKPIQRAIAPMCMEAANLKSNESLIRVGHFSHIECITFDEVRQPKTRKGKDGKPLPWGITRTLANGIYPFGWAKLEFLDLPQEERDETDWPFSAQKLELHLEAINQDRLKAQQDAKAREKRADEKEKIRREREKQLAELEAMSPEDRAVEEIKDPSVSENRVVEIYNQLDEYSEEHQKKLALALKDCWIGKKKWERKECSKKQRLKIQKVKSILGEQ